MVLNHLKKNIAGSFAISVICLFFVLGKSGEILPGNFLFLNPDIVGFFMEYDAIGINFPIFRIIISQKHRQTDVFSETCRIPFARRKQFLRR